MEKVKISNGYFSDNNLIIRDILKSNTSSEVIPCSNGVLTKKYNTLLFQSKRNKYLFKELIKDTDFIYVKVISFNNIDDTYFIKFKYKTVNSFYEFINKMQELIIKHPDKDYHILIKYDYKNILLNKGYNEEFLSALFDNHDWWCKFNKHANGFAEYRVINIMNKINQIVNNYDNIIRYQNRIFDNHEKIPDKYLIYNLPKEIVDKL